MADTAISSRLDRLHLTVKGNRWFRYFTVFNRLALAAGFLPAGLVKITGERFTNLHVKHPLGQYLEALHYTGYYYTFIGIMQVLAALLLLLPRTATLGALLYFPVILNICILSLAVRFEGSLLTSPLMVISNLYLICWDYDKLKYMLPFHRTPRQKITSNKFPFIFFAGVFLTILAVGFTVTNVFDIMPRNSIDDCREQCDDVNNPEACEDFCICIHEEGETLDDCLEEYNGRTRETL